jgi:hypothetical protein
LQVLLGRVFCVDLGSRSGTHWGRQPRDWGWLEVGRAIRIGRARIRLVAASSDREPSPVAATNPLSHYFFQDLALPEVRLDFLNGVTDLSSWKMNRLIALIGKGPGCKLQLMDPDLSPYRGSLVRTPVGVWLIDLLGTGLFTVNGVSSRCALLRDGDHLQVGSFTIRVRYETMPAGLDSENRVLFGSDPAHRELGGRRSVLPRPADQLRTATQPGNGHETALSSLPAPPVSPQPAPTTLPAPIRDGTLAASMPAADAARLVESVLFPLADQFARMQQDMFHQLEQAILMMVRVFEAVHREQMVQVREELNRIRALSSELTELHRERAQLPPPSPAVVQFEAREEPSGVAEPVLPPAAGPGPGVNGAEPDSASGSSPERVGASKVQASQDIHARLSARIAAIQQERQGRMQKIFAFLAGKTSAKPLP